MIHTSNAFKDALLENSHCVAKATILLKNGETLQVDQTDIFQEGVKIDDGTSSTSTFDVGAAVIGKLTLSLNNIKDTFSNVDFTDAVITVWVGKSLGNTMEWLKKGVYNADDPQASASILSIEALDNMEKFDRNYDGSLTFPATMQSIVRHACNQCGVILGTNTFDFDTYVIQKNPFKSNEQVTWREILSHCAQIAGCYARCNTDGQLELKWYDQTVFESNGLDGGCFDNGAPDYQSGDCADGGNFADYASGSAVDGGEFDQSAWTNCHHIYALSGLKVATDDVVITGIRVTASDEVKRGTETLKGETVLYGRVGYVLEITGNPLICYGQAETVAAHLGKKMVGMRFRKMSASCLGDPSIEAGDAAYVTDRKGNAYSCYITNLTYTIGSYERISTDAETPSRNTSKRYSEITKALVEADRNTEAKLSAYDQYVTQMNQLAMNAMGYYQTVETLEDGSRITYMHDKPKLAESMVVYKITADGFFISQDGGKTYSAGIDKNANAVVNVLAAVGINADWINAGELVVKDKQGREMFYASMETGAVRINAERLSIGSNPVAMPEQIEIATSFYLQMNDYFGIPTKADGTGDYTECETTVKAMFGSQDVSDAAAYSVLADSSVTGTWDASAHRYKVTNLTGETGKVTFTVTYQNRKETGVFQVSKNKAGADGVVYVVTPSAQTVTVTDEGLTPGSVTFRCAKRTNLDETVQAAAWLLEKTTDGIAWEVVDYDQEVTGYTKTYTLEDQTWTGIRVTAAPSFWQGGFPRQGLYARTIVSMIKDATALTQEEVFNKLTNNGEWQGLYSDSSGNLYFNASYIKTGMLSADLIQGGTLQAGNKNNEAGQIWVYNDSGAVVATLDKDGLIASKGKFKEGCEFLGKLVSGYSTMGQIMIEGGTIYGYFAGKQRGLIDCAASITYQGTNYRGFQIKTEFLDIKAERLATMAGQSGVSNMCGSGSMSVITNIVELQGALRWEKSTYYFINGLLCSAL
ncbi:MAG: hypothetical protein ACLTOT_14370 [Eubacterium callanderi]|uniref:hypothetical protein n=1 Tax=Eubacterium callanderi TaxID=53442 RepID=UPI00399436A5